MAHIVEMLPRVVATLPVDPKELVRLLERRREVELLVQGTQVKDDWSGNGDGVGRSSAMR